MPDQTFLIDELHQPSQELAAGSLLLLLLGIVTIETCLLRYAKQARRALSDTAERRARRHQSSSTVNRSSTTPMASDAKADTSGPYLCSAHQGCEVLGVEEEQGFSRSGLEAGTWQSRRLQAYGRT